MRELDLHVGIHTKLNRSHLLHARDAWILPCYGRTDIDVQASGVQSVTVEDSMSMVHASRGIKAPASPLMRSEPAIVAGLAAATLPRSATRGYGCARTIRAVAMPSSRCCRTSSAITSASWRRVVFICLTPPRCASG
jgi:hypothetical protein